MMSKVKRDFGDEVWQRISDVIVLAQTNNTPSMWFSTITELIREQEQREKEEHLKARLAALVVEQEKKERILQANKISENLFRVTSSAAQSIVVRRRAAHS